MDKVIGFIVVIAFGYILAVDGTGSHAKLGQLVLAVVGLFVAFIVGIWCYMGAIRAGERSEARQIKLVQKLRTDDAQRQKLEREAQQKAEALAFQELVRQDELRRQMEREAAAKREPGRVALRESLLRKALDEFSRGC